MHVSAHLPGLMADVDIGCGIPQGRNIAQFCSAQRNASRLTRLRVY